MSIGKINGTKYINGGQCHTENVSLFFCFQAEVSPTTMCRNLVSTRCVDTRSFEAPLSVYIFQVRLDLEGQVTLNNRVEFEHLTTPVRNSYSYVRKHYISENIHRDSLWRFSCLLILIMPVQCRVHSWSGFCHNCLFFKKWRLNKYKSGNGPDYLLYLAHQPGDQKPGMMSPSPPTVGLHEADIGGHDCQSLGAV